MMIAATACVLVAGLVATAEDVKPAAPVQPALPKAIQPKAVQPVQPLPIRPIAVTALKMAQLEEDFETVEAHRDVKKAHVKAAEVGVRVAEINLDRLSRLASSNAVAKEEVEKAKLDVDLAKAQVEIRMAELKESEVKVKHAKKRLDDAKLGGVRPPPIIRPVEPKAVDPLPQVRFAADEKEIAELKAKLAKMLVAVDKATADVKRTADLVKVAETELAKRKDIAMRGRVTADFIATAEAKVKEAKDAQEKATKERKMLEVEVAALQKKLKEIEK